MLRSEKKTNQPKPPRISKRESKAVQTIHRAANADIENELLSMSVRQLIQSYLTEMDAKNQAYYFILEGGHYDSFVKYCSPTKAVSK